MAWEMVTPDALGSSVWSALPISENCITKNVHRSEYLGEVVLTPLPSLGNDVYGNSLSDGELESFDKVSCYNML